eukprot:2113916-Prymnesium_polylepis.1
MGLSIDDRNQIEGLNTSALAKAHEGVALTEVQIASRVIARVAANPPPETHVDKNREAKAEETNDEANELKHTVAQLSSNRQSDDGVRASAETFRQSFAPETSCRRQTNTRLSSE